MNLFRDTPWTVRQFCFVFCSFVRSISRRTSSLIGMLALSSFCSCHEMLCKRSQCHHMVSICVSVSLSRLWILSKWINISSKNFHHTILVFPYQTSWQYSDWDPLSQQGIKCRWGMPKSRFWANVWLHRLLWTPSAIHSAVTDHGKLMRLFAGKRRCLLIAGDDDEVYDKKSHRYAKDNRAAFNCT